jgi:vacuolar-type H+-ATPase subunit E/Vma4
LKSIAGQGISLLSEIGTLKIVCKTQDANVIKEVLANYKNNILLDLSLEERYIGGIIMKSEDDKIICDNSISKRIQQAIESRMPSIKKELFSV